MAAKARSSKPGNKLIMLISFRFYAGKEKMNTAPAFLPAVFIPFVTFHRFALAVLRVSVVSRNAFFRTDYLEHQCFTGAALATRSIRALCLGRNSETDYYAVQTLLPTLKASSFGHDGGLRKRVFGFLGIFEVRPAEVRPVEVRPAEVRPAEVRPARSAPLRYAPLRFALLRFAPLRSALLRFVPLLTAASTHNFKDSVSSENKTDAS
jgi:hypothetical protein